MYISVPLVLYVGERTLRAFRSKAYAVKILKVTESSKSSSSISLSACQAPVGTLTDKKKRSPYHRQLVEKTSSVWYAPRGMCRFGLVVSCVLQIVATTIALWRMEGFSHMKGYGMWTVRWGYGARSIEHLSHLEQLPKCPSLASHFISKVS